jgi:dTDP-4-amino-4,6-dideoxygalactose transaminase
MTHTTRTESVAGVPFVDLRPALREVQASVLAEFEQLADAGLFVNGQPVTSFEDEFAEACGTRHCVGLASGLDALRLALIGLGVKAGDEVIVPAMTFIATFEAVVQAGARPVVADVRLTDACLDIEAAAAAVGPRTRCLLPVHLYGQMADMTALNALAAEHDLLVLEDACQAHGATRDGVNAGAAGDAAAFSFYPSKNLGAMGDAGALVTDDGELAARVTAMRQHGEVRRYHSELVGYTSRLDTLQAAVLRHKLPRLQDWNQERSAAAERYSEALEGVGDIQLPVTNDGALHVWHLYTIRTADPEALAASLADRGIATGRHYPEPPHLSAAFEDLGLGPGSFPAAEQIGRETLSLPLFPGITDEQIETVVDGIRRFFDGG